MFTSQEFCSPSTSSKLASNSDPLDQLNADTTVIAVTSRTEDSLPNTKSPVNTFPTSTPTCTSLDSSGNLAVKASPTLQQPPSGAPPTGPPGPSSCTGAAPAGTAARFPLHSSTPAPVTHHPSDRSFHPAQLRQALQGLSEGQVGVTLPLHPPFTPTDQKSFVFPPTNLNPIGEQFSLYSPAFPFNTVKVITPVPGSRDSTKTASPNFALFDNFGLLRSRTPSQEWDNFAEELSFTTDQEWARQRLLTSTDNNLLDHSVAGNFSDVNLDSSSSDSESATMEDLNRELSRIGNLRSNLLRRMRMYTPDDVMETTLDEVKDELQSIHIYMDEYSNNVEAVIDTNKDAMGVELVKKYEDDLEYVMGEVKKHKRRIMDKKKEVFPPPTPLSTYETEMLQYQMKSLKLQETAQAKAETDKKEKATVLTETKSNQFYGETSVMGDLLLDEDWDLADNIVVSQGMRLLNAWQAQMNVIERKYREYENDALLYNFPQAKTDAVDAEYSRIRAKFDSVKEAVSFQDKERGLFTLEPVKTEKVKWPMYYGNPAEDFMKWREKMELAFLKNRVPKDERLDKLREYLRGKALKLVPESTKDIEAAFTVLKEAFGDPARVLDHKLKVLDDCGQYPSDKVGRGLPGYGKQVDWLLQVEGVIRDIIELGEKYGELDRDAFSTATLRKILERFPEKMVAKFNRLKGDGKAKMKGFQAQLAERRVEVQGLDNTYGGQLAASGGGAGGVGGGGGGGNARKVEKGVASAAVRYDASVYFKEPEHFGDCRICNTLTTEGETRGLFTNHLSNYATGSQPSSR